MAAMHVTQRLRSLYNWKIDLDSSDLCYIAAAANPVPSLVHTAMREHTEVTEYLETKGCSSNKPAPPPPPWTANEKPPDPSRKYWSLISGFQEFF